METYEQTKLDVSSRYDKVVETTDQNFWDIAIGEKRYLLQHA